MHAELATKFAPNCVLGVRNVRLDAAHAWQLSGAFEFISAIGKRAKNAR
ncbi:hypothetical protein BSU04_01895 [Caballeronia sordidicola]|uniref:Uncharacterized protein n=1 Tax=Caballeronia sordidicola TaxID=196367 RepID=A0A226XBU6_CABSO|nr:hypothetical protein BSU04_01895 [Caballeronia sordidicola]